MLLGLLAYGFIWLVHLKGPHIPAWLHTTWMFPFFYAGVLFGLSDIVKRLFTQSSWAYAVAVVVYFFFQFMHPDRSITGIFAIIILMQLFSRYDAHIPSLLAKVGGYSLEIYVFHYFFLPALPSLAPWFSWEMGGVKVSNANFVLMLVITFALAAVIVFICIMLATLIRHNKFISTILLGGTFKQNNNSNKS